MAPIGTRPPIWLRRIGTAINSRVRCFAGPNAGGCGLSSRRAAVAIVVAVSLPILLGGMALGIDVSYWATVRVELQRTADIAAMAGAAKYAATYRSSVALTTAANIAELNGLPVGARGGDGVTTLTDQYGAYAATFVFSASPVEVTATVREAVPYFFGRILVSAPSQTIGATAVAQISPRTVSTQACVLGLNGFSSGITTTDDLTISGGKNTSIAMTGCDLRSDGSINFNGSPGLAVPYLIASGATSGSYDNQCESTTGCDQQITGVPQIPDPLASKYGQALSVPSVEAAQPSTTTLSPPPAGESYQSLDFGSNTYTMQPGIYYVSGSVTFNSNSVVNGSGVTIIMGPDSSLTMNGTTTVNLTAPSSGNTAGLLFGSATSNGITFNGNSSLTLGGAIYVPNGSLTISGNTSPAANCLDVVALNVTFAGSSSFSNAGCQSMGVPSMNDYPAVARLVE